MQECKYQISEEDKKMVAEVKAISERGSNAEVKYNKDGIWVVYEVTKKKKLIG